jgi:hypothetical protein
LKKEIRTQLLTYLAKRKFKDWPETDLANNRLLFNLVFFANTGNTTRSYTLRVFYEKQATPIIDIPNVIQRARKNAEAYRKGQRRDRLSDPKSKRSSRPIYCAF